MMRRAQAMLVGLLLFAGCGFVDGTGGTGGGGGGAGGGSGSDSGVSFAQGFTYTRAADRNVYLAEASDYEAPRVLTQSGAVHSPSLSKDKRWVVFVQGSGLGAVLETVAVATGTVTTVLTSTASVRNFKTPVFSPDGRSIAFSYDDGGVTTSLGQVNVDGTGFRRVIGADALAYVLPAFSPDGTALLAGAGNAGLVLDQLTLVTLSTGQATAVGTLGNEAFSLGGRLAWSPDGKRAAFDARISTGATRIFLIDLSSKLVTKANDYQGEPNVSDSSPTWVSATTLAFSSNFGGADNVYTIGLDGSNRTLVLPSAIECWYAP